MNLENFVFHFRSAVQLVKIHWGDHLRSFSVNARLRIHVVLLCTKVFKSLKCSMCTGKAKRHVKQL